MKPLEFGKPNTLVCFISNLFPPTLTVNWQHHSVPVEGVGPTFVSAIDGLIFHAFSYLNFTPEPSDVFSCIVTHEIDRYTAIAFWGEAVFPGSLVLPGAKRDRPVGGAFFPYLEFIWSILFLSQSQPSMPQFLTCQTRYPSYSPEQRAH
jgi:hypothetical protein